MRARESATEQASLWDKLSFLFNRRAARAVSGTGASRGHTVPLMAYVLSCVVFGTSPPVVKTALNYYDPSVLLFWCMFIAMLTITPFAVRSIRQVKINSKKELFLLLLLFMCDPVAYFGFEALAIKNATASQASMAGAVSPMIITFFAWLFLKERFSKIVWGGLILTVLGVMLLSAVSEVSETASHPILGSFFMVLSRCGAAFFIIILRYFEGRFPLSAIIWMQFLVASIVYCPAVINEPAFGLQTAALPLALIIYQGAAVTLGGQMLSAYAVSYAPSHMIGILTPIYPLCAVFFSMLIMGDHLVSTQWAAFALILAGMFICQRFRK